MIGGMCVCMCMSVLCLRGGCIFCVTFPALALSCPFTVEKLTKVLNFMFTLGSSMV